jgi:hypothetical protein
VAERKVKWAWLLRLRYRIIGMGCKINWVLSMMIAALTFEAMVREFTFKFLNCYQYLTS